MTVAFRVCVVANASALTLAAVGGCAETVDPPRLMNMGGATSTGGTGAGNTAALTGGTGAFGTGGAPTTGGGPPTGGVAGYGASGGTTAGGSGGTSESGGTGGIGGTGPPAIGDLVVLHRNGDAELDDNELKPQFQIMNSGTTSIPLSALTLRYWYTVDGTPAGPQDQVVFFDYVQSISADQLVPSFGPLTPAESDADYYFELGFMAGAGQLAGGSNTGEIQTRIHWQGFSSNFNESNDYSWRASGQDFSEWFKVTLYQDGVLVWGQEPDGTVPVQPMDGGTGDGGEVGPGDGGGTTDASSPVNDAAPVDAVGG